MQLLIEAELQPITVDLTVGDVLHDGQLQWLVLDPGAHNGPVKVQLHDITDLAEADLNAEFITVGDGYVLPDGREMWLEDEFSVIGAHKWFTVSFFNGDVEKDDAADLGPFTTLISNQELARRLRIGQIKEVES